MLLNVLVTFVNFIISSISNFISFLINLLPDSPFTILNNLEFNYLDSLNWILPLSFCISVLSYWLLAIGLYYLIQIPLRFVKVVS